MKASRWLLVGLLISMSLLVVSCAAPAQAPGAAPAADTGAAGGPVKITVFSPQGPDTDLATNSFSQEAAEMFNIQFEWQTTTMDGNSAKEQRQISLASGDYPDLYLLIPWVDQFTQLDLLKYGQQGVLLPLNDLIAEYAPNVQAALDNYPSFKAMTVAPDGNIYGVPQLIECYHCSYANKMWVNTKWREALGIEVPTTTEEFAAMLEAFKTQDPNGNGQADEVPLSGSIEDYGVRPLPFLMNGFVYNDDRTFLILNDGQVDTVANKAEWKAGLAYAKSLYDAGLIDPGAFTQNAEAYKKIGDNADAQLLGAGAGMHPAIFVTVGPEAPYGADYDAIPPLTGPNANYATYLYPSVAGATFVLTNKASAEAQVAAVKLLDYMFTQEGQLRAHYGEEGRDWRRPEEGDVALNKSVEPIFFQISLPAGETPHNSSWGAMAQYFQPKVFRDGWVQSVDPAEYYNWPGYERRLQDATDLYAGKESPDHFPFWALWPDPATADAAALQRQNITDYINQNALQFVTGAKNLDSDWDSYVAGLDQLDLAGYLATMQAAYDASAVK
ncbi:ABC transporter substrate-binding protein [Caldilinea sp.]|uniref:ABC transporter substrate-binding protein n=1 Tax=Caldilinea sp. TaxID=2293560 RepID=UPI002BAA4775|nr:extracellular solute-binding protein [Caldilinea sp.]HRA68160.1 extracellular solute-binding protein [Caldilinea sp.]